MSGTWPRITQGNDVRRPTRHNHGRAPYEEDSRYLRQVASKSLWRFTLCRTTATVIPISCARTCIAQCRAKNETVLIEGTILLTGARGRYSIMTAPPRFGLSAVTVPPDWVAKL